MAIIFIQVVFYLFVSVLSDLCEIDPAGTIFSVKRNIFVFAIKLIEPYLYNVSLRLS